MRIKNIEKITTSSLKGKTVAVTGTTGGIGKNLVMYLAHLGADLILLDRNSERSQKFKNEIISYYPKAVIKCIKLDLSDIDLVKDVTEKLKKENINIFINNAGAYKIPRFKCKNSLDNIFQINFLSPYYMIKELTEFIEKAVVVGSIAHNYSKLDLEDVDFSKRTKCALVYGNAKRFLTFSLFRLFKEIKDVDLSVTHPGITFTNITAHYPKFIFMLIKHPMKVIFMKSDIAALSVLKGVFDKTEFCEWIGPKYFNIWGLPVKKSLNTASMEEIEKIYEKSEEMYREMKEL